MVRDLNNIRPLGCKMFFLKKHTEGTYLFLSWTQRRKTKGWSGTLIRSVRWDAGCFSWRNIPKGLTYSWVLLRKKNFKVGQGDLNRFMPMGCRMFHEETCQMILPNLELVSGWKLDQVWNLWRLACKALKSSSCRAIGCSVRNMPKWTYLFLSWNSRR